MYPGSAKFQARPTSPQFANISQPNDYPQDSRSGIKVNVADTNTTSLLGQTNSLHHHHHSMSMRHPKETMNSKSSSGHMGNPKLATGSIGHHRGELVFPDDIDSIEFCMPPPTTSQSNGLNGELMLLHGGNALLTADGYSDRRRRGHNRRGNHKMDVDKQTKWSRTNIAATMERFEPTHHSSSSTSSLEYGFTAGVVTPSPTPSNQLHTFASHSLSGGQCGNRPINHLYSYAYYEPGAAKCHTNIPPVKEGSTPSIIPTPQFCSGSSKSPPRNSIRALLAKSFRSKSNSGQSTSSSPIAEDRHTYTTRYGTTENLYEEVNEQKIRKVLSDNRIAINSAGNVKEELRRVQHNHFRVLDELNLSLEALIMPPSPPDVSPNQAQDDENPTTTTASGLSSTAMGKSVPTVKSNNSANEKPRRGGLLGGASSASSTSSQQRAFLNSLENLSNTHNSIELKDHAHSSCVNPEFDEGDLDSGFSGSGSSSGVSYNESLRYYKSGINNNMNATTTLPHNVRSCRSSTASGTSISKSSMASSDDQAVAMIAAVMSGCGANSAVGNGMLASPFSNTRRGSDMQRASARSISASSATGTKPKKNFWTIKP